MKKTILLLILIFLLGAFFRFYRLGDIPVGFHRDEAFLGYNAYSILKTGKDMNGNFLPIHFQSFLYSPAGYSYFSIPSIKFFDLNAFSVRFPSALFGTLTVFMAYFLVKALFLFHPRGVPRAQHHLGGVETLALVSSLFLAISPWHINLSRTATENVLAVFFVSLGVLLFLVWHEKQKLHLLLFAFLSFAITLLLYQAPRAFLPFFIPLLFILFRKPNIDRIQRVFAVGLFFAFIFTPLVYVFSSQELSLRIRTVSVFATSESQLAIDEMIREDGVSDIKGLITRIFHNKPLTYSSQVFQNYFEHFSYDFLFTDQGFPGRYRIPHSGLIYLFELPFLILGMWGLLKKNRKIGLFLIGWVALGPVGSAFAFDDVPNLQRTLLIFPALSIITAYGLLYFLMLLRTKRIVFVGTCLLTVIAIYSVVFYLHQYYVHGPRYRPWYRNDGYKELVKKTNELLPFYKKVIITDRESAPTIFYLFYQKYNPDLFQKETKGLPIKDFDRIEFGNYQFSQEECPLKMMKNELGEEIMTGEREVLYVNSGLCKQFTGEEELDIIRRSDESIVFKIVKVI